MPSSDGSDNWPRKRWIYGGTKPLWLHIAYNSSSVVNPSHASQILGAFSLSNLIKHFHSPKNNCPLHQFWDYIEEMCMDCPCSCIRSRSIQRKNYAWLNPAEEKKRVNFTLLACVFISILHAQISFLPKKCLVIGGRLIPSHLDIVWHSLLWFAHWAVRCWEWLRFLFQYDWSLWKD